MTIATRQIRFQTGNNKWNRDAPQIVETFNNVTDLMLDVGMIHVDEGDYPGQAGKFVLSSPGEGETLFERNDASGWQSYGSNLFKHPVADLYILVAYGKNGHSSWAYNDIRFAGYRTLSGGGLLEDWGEPFSLTDYSGSSTSPPGETMPINCMASCEDDHFWIGSTALPYGNYPPATSTGYPQNLLPIGAIGAAFFITQHGDILALFPELRWIMMNSASPLAAAPVWGNTTNSLEYIMKNAQFTAALAHDANAWLRMPEGSTCTLLDPARPMVENRIRVSMARAVIGERYHDFNYGFAPAGTIPDGSTIEIDFGAGLNRYISLTGFGAGRPYQNRLVQPPLLSDTTTILLPWNE